MLKKYFKKFSNESINKIEKSIGEPAFYESLENDYSFVYRPNNTGSKAIGELIFFDKDNKISLLFIDWGSTVSISQPSYPSAYATQSSDEEIEQGLKLIKKANKYGCVDFSLNDSIKKIVETIDPQNSIQKTTNPEVKVKHVVYVGFFDALEDKLKNNTVPPTHQKTKSRSLRP